MEYLEKCKEQFQYAMAVPKELFDIGMHKYVKKIFRYKNLVRILCRQIPFCRMKFSKRIIA